MLIIFVGLLIVDRGEALSTRISGKQPANTLTVSGEGKVEAVPDLATVTIGVISQGKTAQEVKDSNNQKVAAVVKFVKDQGVPEKDIQTTNLNLSPQQDWTSGRATIIGYQGNQSITVKFNGVDKSQDKVEKVLDGAVNAGANEIYGPTFEIKDPDELRQQARKLAIAKAKEKAQELASEAGLTLGKIVSVSESGGYYPPIPVMYGKASSGVAVAPTAENQSRPDIQVGQQEISQVMTVVFEVK